MSDFTTELGVRDLRCFRSWQGNISQEDDWITDGHTLFPRAALDALAPYLWNSLLTPNEGGGIACNIAKLWDREVARPRTAEMVTQFEDSAMVRVGEAALNKEKLQLVRFLFPDSKALVAGREEPVVFSQGDTPVAIVMPCRWWFE